MGEYEKADRIHKFTLAPSLAMKLIKELALSSEYRYRAPFPVQDIESIPVIQGNGDGVLKGCPVLSGSKPIQQNPVTVKGLNPLISRIRHVDNAPAANGHIRWL